jgi:hypothetical protein
MRTPEFESINAKDAKVGQERQARKNEGGRK